MGHLRHSIVAERRRCRCGARMPLHIALQLEHLRGEHQVNGFMGCDCHIEVYVPEGVEVRYRIWTAGAEVKAIEKS